MAQSNTATPNKRLNDDSDLRQTKKIYEKNQTSEQVELTKLLNLAENICETLDIEIVQPIDLDKSAKLSDILFQMFMYLSKRATAIMENNTDMQTVITQQYSKMNITVGERIVSVISIVQILEDKKQIPEFDYTIATPLINMICLFELKFKETALGNYTIYIRRNEEKSIRMNVSSFGVNTTFSCLLNGSTFPTERRAGVLRAMGSLTLAISLVMEKQNQDLVKKAFIASISYLENSKKLANWFARAKKAELGVTLLMLGKVVLLNMITNQGPDTSARFFAFPLLALLVAYKTELDMLGRMEFTGPGGNHLYSTIAKYNYSIKSNETDGNKIKQSIFHGIFGTAYEDLGVLAEITDVKYWFNRFELSDTYANGTTKIIQGLPSITKYSPFVSDVALELEAATNMSSDNDTFSTRRELENYLNQKIDTLFGNLKKMVEKSTTITTGTTKWYEAPTWDNTKQKYVWGKETDFIVETTNEFFYNSR